MKKVLADCFVAGILKGMIERSDYTRHFGSTLGIRHHIETAKSLGVIEVSEGGKPISVTDLGRSCYEQWGLASKDNTRAYLWGLRESDLVVPVGE